ncbi:hypothetical protein ABH933_001260 [Nocardia sp. GP40]|uniref:Lsr2 dimerization domain-containing protein n=1 Tax=Nocardia sp. GP40 TaxID=3156268 RepID=UPI003D1BBD54
MKKTTISLVDDRDGISEAAETVRFSIDGVQYETDLTTANAMKLRQEFGKWKPHARRKVGPRKLDARRPGYRVI